jgi:hypothetical protein
MLAYLTTEIAEQLIKQWNTPIYAFFKPTPAIDQIEGHHAHMFECSAKICKGKGNYGQHIWWYLNTADAMSTSNLRCHAKVCWGLESMEAAGTVKDVYAACAMLAKPWFHNNKEVFVNLGIWENVNGPKIHSLMHCSPSICLFDTNDNYNTEQTEQLHIDLTKWAFSAMNKKDEILR